MKRVAILRIALSLAALISLGGCGANLRGEDVKPVDQAISTDKLRSAPTRIEIAGRSFILETYLWRDFQPLAPPDGEPLRASISLIADGAETFPAKVDADRLWIIKGGEVWETQFQDEGERTEKPSALKKVAGGGPKWDTKEKADVIVRVVDGGGGSYMLRAAEQKIHRTD